MPQNRSNKSQTPINSDAFNLTPDLATLSDTLGVIVSVADQTEGDSVATARAAEGWPVSDARPLYVYNVARNRIEIKNTAGWSEFRGPLGMIGRTSNLTTSTGLDGTQILGDYVQVNLIINRWYRVSYENDVVSTGAASLAIGTIFKTHASDNTTSAGTDLGPAVVNYSAPQAANGRTMFSKRTWQASATSTLYVKAVEQRLTGSALYDISNRILTVEDLGAAI